MEYIIDNLLSFLVAASMQASSSSWLLRWDSKIILAAFVAEFGHVHSLIKFNIMQS